MIAVVAVLAVVVGGAVAGITAATSDNPSGVAAVGPTVRSGSPPLSLDLGVRTDPEAVDLREASRLYDAGKRTDAEKIFARHNSLEARVGEAFSTWPNGTVAGLTQLSGLHPKSAAVQLNLGIARFWAGEAGAEDAWKSAASLEPDTAYAVTAGNLLYPDFARNLPIFVPSTEVPKDIRKLAAPAQVALLERRAQTGTVADRLFYGVALQRLGKQRSAERVFAAAAKAAPNDPGGTRGGGRWALRQGPPRQGVLPPRATLARVPEGRHRPLPPRPVAALVGPGEGGASASSCSSRRPSPARRSSASRIGTWPSFARRGSKSLPFCWPSVTKRGDFLTGDVSDRYGHSGFDERGQC